MLSLRSPLMLRLRFVHGRAPQTRFSAAWSLNQLAKQGEDMKLLKYVLVLAIALCAIASVSNAQVYIGGGSSALFLELGQAAVIDVAGSHSGSYCLYSNTTSTLSSSSTVDSEDNRTSSDGATATTEKGNFWIVWGPNGSCATPDTSNPIYMYTSLDSVLGDRGYFESDPGISGGCAAGAGYCQILSLGGTDNTCPGTVGTLGGGCQNLLSANPPTGFANMNDNAPIPASLQTLINNAHWNWAGTDIRPEDALFATFRALSSCNAWIARQPFDLIVRYTQGLGYTDGATVQDAFSGGKTFHIKNFGISGSDPLSGGAIPGYTVTTVGAQPIIIGVSPLTSLSASGIANASDIPGYVAANFFSGVLGRASDLLSTSGTAIDNWAVTALVREPVSGTYNTFEYGAINNSQFHVSQDLGNCTSSGANPILSIVSANGASLEGGTEQAFRKRVIGTSQMVSQLNKGTQAVQYIGYFFWSAANAAGLTNVKYLKYNGVDPITTNYATNGILPGSGASGDPCQGNITSSNTGCPGVVTFAGLNSGDYALWSALRIVSANPTPAAITRLVTNMQTLNSTSTDFVPLSTLNPWRSHFQMSSINVGSANMGPTISTTGDLCPGGAAESGGDVGGAIILKQADAHFCSDYSNTTGLINKTE
jgi:hypothetical protein